MAKILKINPNNPDRQPIKEAAGVMSLGGIIIYPTDTAYGIGVNALDVKAVKKLYELKGRDFSKPTHMVCKNWKQIKKYAQTNKRSLLLYKKFMPGPLTIILKKKPLVPDILTANLPTIGLRIPDSSVTKKLSSLLAFPYTTPSANKAGGKTPYSVKNVLNELDTKKVDLILDGGKLIKKLPSTIVSISNKYTKVLRKGPITNSEIKKVLSLTLQS